MAEAPWMKKHEEVMALEERKAKLLAEIEPLETEKRDLVSTLTVLRKEVSVHGGDYDTITAERVKTVDELDEKFITLTEGNKEEENTKIQLSRQLDNLSNYIEKLEKESKKSELEKQKLETEIGELTSDLKKLKAEKQDEEEQKRLILKGLTEEVGKLQKERKQLMTEEKEAKEEILRENRLLAIRRSDLQIYEARMRKKYPNEVFILKDAITSAS